MSTEDDGNEQLLRTASMHLARPGERLPGTAYRLIERLGGGGMGQVFRAEHVELGREVAIKLLAPALAHDPKAMERLRREARAAARLGNPHIIDVYDLGITDDGRPYVVMKLIPGRDLKAVADAEAPLDPHRVVRLVRQIGDALRAAHATGVVHRDLKPENVLVERRGDDEVLTILDFGIAQSIQDTDTRLTRDGQMIGTPGYMAPEQALAKPLDGRADQYAVAVMTYELLSGRSPFDRLSPLQLIAAQLTEEPTPLGDVVDPQRVPAAMVDVVMRGLARDPDARYPEIHEFVEALAEAGRAPVAAAPRPAPRPRRSSAALVAAVAVLGAALGVLAVFLPDRGPDPIAPTVGMPPETPVEPTLAVAGGAPAPTLPEPTAPTPAEPIAPEPVEPVAPAPTPPKPAPAPEPAAPAPAAPKPAAAPPARAPRPAPARPDPAPPRPDPAPAEPAPAAEPEKPRPVAPPPAPVEPPPDPTPAPPAPTTPAVAAIAPPSPPPTPDPPAGPPKLTFGGLDVVGGASTRQIRRTVSDGFGAIRRCVEGKPGLRAGGRATVRFVIDADGFFGGFDGDGDPALVACGTEVLRRINRLDRRPDTGDIRVALPMRLEAP